MSSSGMFLLLSALMLHSARGGSADNSTGTDKTLCQYCESCLRRQTDVEVQLCVDDSVKAFLKNLHDFVCQHLSVNSTCMCVNQGFGLLAVQVPPLHNDTELAVVTLCGVNASFTVSAKDCSCTVLCSCNATEGDHFKDLLEKVWMILKQPRVIVAFLTGLLLSAFVCFLGRKCHRKKPRGSGNKADGVATSQAAPLTDGQSADNGRIFDEGEVGATGHSAVELREVEYSDIDFSRWNRNSPAGTEHAQEATETEYAELQKDGNRQEPEENSGDSEEDVAVAIDEEETEQ